MWRLWRVWRKTKRNETTLTEDNSVPPLGHLRVLGHKARVDVGLLADRAARLVPDLLAVVQERVCDRRWQRPRRKHQPSNERERG